MYTGFKGHYIEWRKNRIDVILNALNQSITGKRILELGCGYGELGLELESKGAILTYSDARKENIDGLRAQNPNAKAFVADANTEWPYNEKYDIIINFGLLYHLSETGFEFCLRNTCKNADIVFVETECCDSDDPYFLLPTDENTGTYDQGTTDKTVKPSVGVVERILTEEGFSFNRIEKGLNSWSHCYDWSIRNTKTWGGPQTRKFWHAFKT